MILAKSCRTGPPGYVDWRAVRQPYARVDYIPQSGIKNLSSVWSLFRRPNNFIFPAIWKTVEQTGEDRNQRRQRGARRGSKLSKYLAWPVCRGIDWFPEFPRQKSAILVFDFTMVPQGWYSELIFFAASCDCDDIIGIWALFWNWQL